MSRDEEKITAFSRDPFGRFDRIKRYYGIAKCDWCGEKRKVWEYGIWHDGGRKDWSRGHFCSKSCHDTYHG